MSLIQKKNPSNFVPGCPITWESEYATYRNQGCLFRQPYLRTILASCKCLGGFRNSSSLCCNARHTCIGTLDRVWMRWSLLRQNQIYEIFSLIMKSGKPTCTMEKEKDSITNDRISRHCNTTLFSYPIIYVAHYWPV